MLYIVKAVSLNKMRQLFCVLKSFVKQKDMSSKMKMVVLHE